MTEQEHLSAIKARCEALLEGAKPRTQGQWIEDTPSVFSEGQSFILTDEQTPKADLAFIASCAGPAEAGWKATIAAIDLAFYSMGFIPAHQITFKPMIDAIRTAWPVELL